MLVKIGNEYLEYTILSANCFQIVDSKKLIMPIMDKNNNIIGLDFIKGRLNLNDTLSLNFKDTFSDFCVKIIKKFNNSKTPTYLLYTTRINLSSLFILPSLGNNCNFFGEEYIINTYLQYNDNVINTIIIEYRFVNDDNFTKILKNLTNHKYFIKTKEKDYFTTLVYFKIPEEHLNDIKLFIQGKYSELSEKLKKKILLFYSLSTNGYTAQILRKSPELKNQLELELDTYIPENSELHDIPNSKNEIYYE